MKNRDLEAIIKIKLRCKRVLAVTNELKTLDKFNTNQTARESIILNLSQIGENVKEMLSEEFKEEHSNISWREIISLRHKIVHHYDEINNLIIWEIAKNYIPDLLFQLNEIVVTTDRT